MSAHVDILEILIRNADAKFINELSFSYKGCIIPVLKIKGRLIMYKVITNKKNNFLRIINNMSRRGNRQNNTVPTDNQRQKATQTAQNAQAVQPNETAQPQTAQLNLEEREKQEKRRFFISVFVPICVPLAITALSVVVTIIITTNVNKTNIQNISDRINEISSSIETSHKEINENINSVSNELENYKESTNEELKDINRSLGKLEGIYSSGSIKCSGGEYENFVRNTYDSGESVFLSSGVSLPTELGNELTRKADDESILTTDDLANEKVLMSYIDEDGEEVYFSGQIDEKGRWNNRCIINKYNGNMLSMIMDSIYESGILKGYRQLFSFTNSNGTAVWAIAERNISDESTSGNTVTFYKTANNEIVKNFDFDTLTDIDIMNIDDFVSQNSLILEGYYNGYTSNGYFNDDTGDAYLVKYDIYGFVRTLYVGKIQNGNFHDTTGNAWYIVRDPDKKTKYMYYKGNFVDGQREDSDEAKPGLSYEQIQRYLGYLEFDCPLNWYIETDV